MPVRILIADDDSTIRMLFRRMLEAQPDSQVCSEAVNGVEAVEQAARVAPDVAILDLSMPVMNGLDAARKFPTQILSYPCCLSAFREYRTNWSKQPERPASAEQLPRVAAAKWCEALRRSAKPVVLPTSLEKANLVSVRRLESGLRLPRNQGKVLGTRVFHKLFQSRAANCCFSRM